MKGVIVDPWRGWQQNILGMWLPPTPVPVWGYAHPLNQWEVTPNRYWHLGPQFEQVSFKVRQQWGMEVREDGCRLFDQELNAWRDADRLESIQIRQAFYGAFGPEISRIAGIEPE